MTTTHGRYVIEVLAWHGWEAVEDAYSLTGAQGKLAAFREQHPERASSAYRIRDTEETA